MQKIDTVRQWVTENGFSLEDVAEDHIDVYMKPIKLITLVVDIKEKGECVFSAHVSWDGENCNFADFTFEEFKHLNNALTKLTIV